MKNYRDAISQIGNLILTWFTNCIISNAPRVTKFAITHIITNQR